MQSHYENTPLNHNTTINVVFNTVNSGNQTNYYSGGYQKIITGSANAPEIKEINYISTPVGLGAIYVADDNASGQTADLYLTYTDHQGSINVLTDTDGNIVHEQSFDAWGKRTTANTQGGANNPTNPDFSWLRGYTGHEHLEEFDLINMNGRLYDPSAARMLSPDNFVQSPFYSQNYNRYSYVYNNPLKYTDPTGMISQSSIATVQSSRASLEAGNQYYIDRMLAFQDMVDNNRLWLGGVSGAGVFQYGGASSYGGTDGLSSSRSFQDNGERVTINATSYVKGTVVKTGDTKTIKNARVETTINGQTVTTSISDELFEALVFGGGDGNGDEQSHLKGRVTTSKLQRDLISLNSSLVGGIGATQIGLINYRKSLSINSKIGTFSRFRSIYGKLGYARSFLGRGANLIGAPLTIYMDYGDLQSGEISPERFTYRTTGVLLSIGTGAAIGAEFGGPWGAVGGASIGLLWGTGELVYDKYYIPLKRMIYQQTNNFENAVRGGWYPGR